MNADRTGLATDVQPAAPAIDLAGAIWQKSSRSGPFTDNCVEVAFVGDIIAVRDSKDPNGPALVFTPKEWDAFVDGAKIGEFDL